MSEKHYLRLDLTPDGYDLNEYLENRCKKIYEESGRSVSKSAYIQQLIIADMKIKRARLSKKDRLANKIKDIIYTMSDTELGAIDTLIRAIKKRG